MSFKFHFGLGSDLVAFKLERALAAPEELTGE